MIKRLPRTTGHTTAKAAVVCFLLAAATGALAQKPRPLTLVIDGKEISEPPAPRIIAGRTYVPLRLVSEHLGITVHWQAKERRAVLCRGEWCLMINEGTGPEEGRIIEGRMFVPLRRVATGLGAKTEYDADKRRVIITPPPKKPDWLKR